MVQSAAKISKRLKCYKYVQTTADPNIETIQTFIHNTYISGTLTVSATLLLTVPTFLVYLTSYFFRSVSYEILILTNIIYAKVAELKAVCVSFTLKLINRFKWNLVHS